MFERRFRIFQKRLKLLAVVSLLVPLIAGLTVMTFGLTAKALPKVILICGIIGALQALVSAVSLVYHWEDHLTAAKESQSANLRLYRAYERIAKTPPPDASAQVALLDAEDGFQSDKDSQALLTDKEIRRGHRAALRQFQRACASCKITPVSMEATECDVCGNF
jgi:mobilome CxxCx(11)CxxC protein